SCVSPGPRRPTTPPAEVPGAQPPAFAAAPQTLPADTAETSSASVAQAVAPDSSTINSASPLGAAPAEPPADTLQKPAAAPPAAAVAEQPVIKPVRRHFQVRAGGSLLTGWDRPHRLGISPLRGQGLSASVSLWRSRLWLTAGADWMRLKEDAPVYWNEYHPSATPPKPFKGGGPHQHYEELVRVQSTQRQNRFQLGLRYELPSIWRLRPTVQAGHVWAKNASAFVRYTYEDKDPGGPWPGSKSFDFVAEEEPKYTHSQIWLAGAGLEYDLRDWTFHVRTEYQAQTGSVAQPTFDALLLRAGLEYRIR
ncbi:MAG TPA: hypothetical protein PK858_04175, partial [Saprospiraceae bacterium]|nr:hypothetical protein [Saprospiraceae bacterium]